MTDDEHHCGRDIGIEVRGVYDGMLIWKCRSCGEMTPRFSPEANRGLYVTALEIIEVRR